MHSKSDDIEFMPKDNANEIVNELFLSPFLRYQIGLETSMRRNDFIFDSVQLLHYKCHKINFKCGDRRRGRESYIDPPAWIKKKKATINPKNEDNKCFQYAATAALNHEEIKIDQQRISKIKTFINKYNWNRIKYQSETADSKMLEKNNPTNALNILYIKEKKYTLLLFQNIAQPVKNKYFF